MNELLSDVRSLDTAVWNGPAIIALRITAIAIAAWLAAAVLDRMIRVSAFVSQRVWANASR